jgi:hypothetical protein
VVLLTQGFYDGDFAFADFHTVYDSLFLHHQGNAETLQTVEAANRASVVPARRGSTR